MRKVALCAPSKDGVYFLRFQQLSAQGDQAAYDPH